MKRRTLLILLAVLTLIPAVSCSRGNTPADESGSSGTVTETPGGSETLPAGTQMLFLSGTATMTGAGLTDVTAGEAVASGAVLSTNHLYVAAAECTLQASAETKILMK